MLQGNSFDETWGTLKCICASAYGGEDMDFGSGPKLWLDNEGAAEGTLQVFREYFEDEAYLKVWHNYSFDARVLYWAFNVPGREFTPRGLGADTLHMARLWDTSRFKGEGFSLDALTRDLVVDESSHKIPMTDRFGIRNLKQDGTLGSRVEVPRPLTLQTDPATRRDFIDYSVGDAKSTWLLHAALKQQLQQQPWERLEPGLDMFDFYEQMWVPFGQLLVEMELSGICIDRAHLGRAEELANKALEEHSDRFLDWARQVSPDADAMNLRSGPQKMQLLFAPCSNARDPARHIEREKTFDVPNITGFVCPDKVQAYEEHLAEVAAKEVKRDLLDQEKLVAGKTVRGLPRAPLKRKKAPVPLKNRPITLRGIGLPVIKTTVSGWPSCDEKTLRTLVHDSRPALVSLIRSLGSEAKAKEALAAIESLAEFTSIDKLRSSYIANMKDAVCPDGRMRSFLNINTETGRLSSRKPNLQSQPALEKDRYGIRHAFVAESGKSLIVLDYGQLELRVLAAMTNCKSMIEAFAAGGDFHSRTAMGMYPEVAKAVEEGKVLLEAGEGSAIPLLKDVYKTERKNAKTLNFAIAYGMTVHGLIKALGVTREGAQDVQERWYADRPEVRDWQEAVREKARQVSYCDSILGRRRALVHITSKDQQLKGHHERACINSPIQGGAADVVMCAMIAIHSDERLRELGWRLILQIHDEVILEGPSESAEEAFAITSHLMAKSFPMDLPVELLVDGSIGQNWGDAK